MSVTSAVVIGVAIVGAVTDLRTRRIPNVLTFGAALAAFLYHLVHGGVLACGLSVGGWLVGAGLFLPFFALGGLGAGDVKLIAALGAWLGPVGALYVAAGTAIAGGAVAVLESVRRRYLTVALTNVWMLLMHFRTSGLRPMPELTLEGGTSPRLAYAVPILIGTLGALWFR